VLSDGFRAAAESKDFSRLPELTTEEVVFRSPVVFKPYQGREALMMLLSGVVQVFEDFEYVDQVETGNTAVLVFRARIGDRAVDGVDVLRFNDDGQITEMMVMVRPISGINALAEAMQRKLSELEAAAAS
jgi:hypothetical protein